MRLRPKPIEPQLDRLDHQLAQQQRANSSTSCVL
jgi:hypothetical protein